MERQGVIPVVSQPKSPQSFCDVRDFAGSTNPCSRTVQLARRIIARAVVKDAVSQRGIDDRSLMNRHVLQPQSNALPQFVVPESRLICYVGKISGPRRRTNQ